MNKPLKRRTHGAFSRALLFRYFLALFASLAGFVALLLLARVFFSQFTWQPENPLYQFLTLISDHLIDIIFLACICLPALVSIVFMWIQFRYLDAVVEASERLLESGGEPIELPSILKRVESRMNLARQKSLQNERAAREAEQRKNDLVVYLAHDLKTPLTSVIGYLTLLRDEPQISPELRAKYTGIALDKALRLEDLTNEFFEITRFNLTHISLEKEPVDLARMLQQVTSEFEPAFAEKNLRAVLDLPGRLDYECDADKMARVFDNLLRNAESYSFRDSEIRISAALEEQAVLLRFENAGKTIPPEKLSRIFEQFFRMDSSRGSQSGGAGLGLAIAREIVELHGGTISAESQDSRVIFTVRLPLPGGSAAP